MMNKPLLQGAGGGPSSPTVQPVTLRTNDTVEVNLALCQGPIAGLALGPRSFYLNGTPLMSQNGSNNFNPFEVHLYHGDDTASPIRNVLGGTTSNTAVGVTLAQATPLIRTTPQPLRDQIDILELRFYIQSLVSTNSDGDQLFNTLSLDVEFREAGTSTWLPFFQRGKTLTITGRINGAVKEFMRQVPRIDNDYEIRVTKNNADNDLNNIAEVSWESFQCTTRGAVTYDNLAVVRALSSVTEQLNGVPELSGVYHGQILKIPSNYDPVARYYAGTWDGTFKEGFTDNPAWALYYLLTDPVTGAKAHYPDLQVDRFSFYQAAQWCDQLVPRPGGGYQPRYTYNDLMHQERSGLEAIHYLAAIFGGRLVEDAGGTVLLKVDQPGTPKQIFGPESVSTEGFTYQYTDVESRPNEFRVTFCNPDLNWEDDIRIVRNQSYIDRNGRNSQDFVAVGCIDVYEAQRRAELMLLQANTEIQTVSFKAARQSLLLDTFDIIGISDPDMTWGLSGRIKAVTGSNIFLRDETLLPANTNITMKVQAPSGVTTLVVRSATPVSTKLTIMSGTLPSDLPDRAQFTLEEASIGLVKPFRILTIDEDQDHPDFADITALEINVNKWGDADQSIGSGTIDYGSTPLQPGSPTSIVVESGTSQLLRHTDGTIESRIHVSWDINTPSQVRVFYRRLNATQFDVIPATGTQVHIPNVLDGAAYVIELQVYDSTGAAAYRTAPIVHTVVGKTQGPSVPTGWGGRASYSSITLSGNRHPDPDFSTFNIYGATVSDPSLVLLASVTATSWTRQVPAGDVYTRYAITAVDTTGNESTPTGFIAVVPDAVLIDDLFTDAGVSVPKIVTALPVGNPNGWLIVYLTTDQKLYRWDSGLVAWSPMTDPDEIGDGTLDAIKVTAGSIVSGLIAAAAVRVDNMEIDTTLRLDADTAGLSIGKDSYADRDNSGLFAGRQATGGGAGFGFLLGTTSVTGIERYIEASDTLGLRAVNINFGLQTDVSLGAVTLTTTQNYNLAAGTETITLTVLGGGGGPAEGGKGGTPTVALSDGGTPTGVSWASPGGVKGASGGLNGQNSTLGAGGLNGATTRSTQNTSQGPIYTYTTNPGTNATGYGAGAGGINNPWSAPANVKNGGAAATPKYVVDFDVSGLVAPKLVITIGLAGSSPNAWKASGGVVSLKQKSTQVVDAGVVPFAPTFTAQFTKGVSASGNIIPSPGASQKGLWVVSTSTGAVLNMVLQIDSAGTPVNAMNDSTVTFVSNVHPTVISSGTATPTVRVSFYHMNVDG